MNDVERLTLGALFYEIGRFIVRADGNNGSFLEIGHQWFKSVFSKVGNAIADHSTLVEKAAKLASGYTADGLPPEPQERGGALVSIFSLLDHAAQQPQPLLYYPQEASNICQYPVHKIKQHEMTQKYKALWQSFDQECLSLNGSITVSQALVLLEKYTSYMPYVPSPLDSPYAGISLFDQLKLTAALARCLHLAGEQSYYPFLLVGGDFSGVQDFVYRISSKGALKALRGRSFFLELLTEHVINEILQALELSAANILINGGAIFNLILPNTEKTCTVLDSAARKLNEYLLKQHDGKLYLALAHVKLAGNELTDQNALASKWKELGQAIATVKGRKFADLLKTASQWGAFLLPEHLLKEAQSTTLQHVAECPWCGATNAKLKRIDWQDEEIYGCKACLNEDKLKLDECEVCHRMALLSPLPPPREDVMACSLCRNLYHLGEHLYYLRYVIGRSVRDDNLAPLQKAIIKLPNLTKDKEWVYYYFPLAAKGSPEQAQPQDFLQDFSPDSTVASFVINKWDLAWYCLPSVRLFSLGNYPGFKARASQSAAPLDCAQEVPLEFEELAGCAQGIRRLGVLRMDVDNLGDIFIQRLKGRSLAHRMALSRAMTYFFKLHLNELCHAKDANVFPQKKQTRLIESVETRIRNAIIIYSGGDDLFVVGTWNDTVELAFDIHSAFAAYTSGGHVTLSAGLIVQDEKFPLYQMARFSKKALSAAKANSTTASSRKPEKDSFALFHPAFIFELLQGDELRPHAPAALRWTGPGPVSAQNCLKLAQQMAACLGNGEPDERWELVAPRSFLRNLFSVVEAAHQEGQLSLPKLAYALSRVSLEDEKKQKQFDEELKPQLRSLGSEALCYLHPALVWLEMRLRREESKL